MQKLNRKHGAEKVLRVLVALSHNLQREPKAAEIAVRVDAGAAKLQTAMGAADAAVQHRTDLTAAVEARDADLRLSIRGVSTRWTSITNRVPNALTAQLFPTPAGELGKCPRATACTEATALAVRIRGNEGFAALRPLDQDLDTAVSNLDAAIRDQQAAHLAAEAARMELRAVWLASIDAYNDALIDLVSLLRATPGRAEQLVPKVRKAKAAAAPEETDSEEPPGSATG